MFKLSHFTHRNNYQLPLNYPIPKHTAIWNSSNKDIYLPISPNSDKSQEGPLSFSPKDCLSTATSSAKNFTGGPSFAKKIDTAISVPSRRASLRENSSAMTWIEVSCQNPHTNMANCHLLTDALTRMKFLLRNLSIIRFWWRCWEIPIKVCSLRDSSLEWSQDREIITGRWKMRCPTVWDWWKQTGSFSMVALRRDCWMEKEWCLSRMEDIMWASLIEVTWKV